MMQLLTEHKNEEEAYLVEQQLLPTYTLDIIIIVICMRRYYIALSIDEDDAAVNKHTKHHTALFSGSL